MRRSKLIWRIEPFHLARLDISEALLEDCFSCVDCYSVYNSRIY